MIADSDRQRMDFLMQNAVFPRFVSDPQTGKEGRK